VAHKHLSLGQSIQKEESAIEFADSIMSHLLTSGANDGSSSSQCAAALGYRGNRVLSEVPQTKQTLALLLRELGLASSSALDGGPAGQYVFEMGRLTSHLQMDRVASEAINLLPSPGTTQNRDTKINKNRGETSSIYGILNQCHTRMGSRLLESWLRQPLVDRDQIVRRHDVVEFLVERSVELSNLRESGLKAVTDLDVLASRLSKYEDANASATSPSSSSCAALETLYRMYLFADQQLPLLLRSLKDMVDDNDSKQQDGAQNRALDVCRGYCTELESVEGALQKAKGLTETVLDLTQVPREFLVKSNFDEELQNLHIELGGIEDQLKELHQAVDDEWSQVNNCGSGQVRLERTDNSGSSEACAWQFRLPNTNDEKVLREKFSDTVQIHRVLKNGVYFSTHELRDLGSSKQDVLVEYKRRQGSIVDQAMKVAGTFCPVLEQASSIIGEIDALSSFAHVAAYQGGSGGYCRPVMTDDDSGGNGIQVCTTCLSPISRISFNSSRYLLFFFPACESPSPLRGIARWSV
jgi:DNA mismatch repair protein MSH2